MLRTKSPYILRLDVSGFPVAWTSWEEAICLYVKGQVAWEAGEHAFSFRGGTSRLTGKRSSITVNSIVAVHGNSMSKRIYRQTPHLNNRELFRRDNGMCMYCGQSFPDGALTRDHIIPRSKGGKDIWTNVVAACRRCNGLKGGQTTDQAHLQLLAIPFVPNPAEYLALKNRRILMDQMEFLKKQFRHDRLLNMKVSHFSVENEIDTNSLNRFIGPL